MAKKTGSILAVLGIFAGIGVIAYAAVGSRLKKLSVGFDSFSTNIKFSFPYLYIPVNIVLTNPNKNAVTFQGLTADVVINGEKATALSYTKSIQLPAGKDTTISGVLIKTEVFSATNQTLDVILSKSISVKMVGTMRADNMNYPFNTNLNLK